MKRICSGKSSNLRPSNTLKFVEPAKSTSALRSLFHLEKRQNVAKTASASSHLSAPKVSEKTPEKALSEKIKSNPCRSLKLAVVEPHISGKVVKKIRSRTNEGSTPTTGSSGKSGIARSTATIKSQTFYIPLRSSNGVTSRIYRPAGSGVFHYHLSDLEEAGFGRSLVFPMKSVPAAELQLLRNGQRINYLERRYERSPDDKYNYPEATSWRYGWFHRESDLFQKRVPRRD
ncbi:uncharacterized protein LOC108039812 [Drosophila rhopaloa]|uniref:Uncharacterized protein LOC108039812 n=1 Tax=Drosophila rhopaloa TaxID=1041015 RepID=A0A6P4EB63_DRORH|nr:uncharacterized protein LOC108039812 [Drosophila rhopaloa]